MRLVCPQCMSNVTVPDDMAGKEATCPNCGKSFPTPSRYTAAVSELGAAVAGGVAGASAPPPGVVPPPAPVPATAPAAPPGFVPPAPDGFASGAAHAATLAPTGYAHSVGITIAPKVVEWLPAALLTAVFLLTFFPWVGSYVGNSAVYWQRPWGAAFGTTPNRNFKFEEAKTIPSGWLDKKISDWKLLIPFFLLLLIGLAFAWAERGLGEAAPQKIPPLIKLWPWRNAIVAGCATLALLFLLLQMANGFAMERAIQQYNAEKFAEARAAAANSPATLATLEYAEEQEFHKYNVEWTTWLYLAVLCNALAVGAVLTHVVLESRGNKPPPKLLLHY